MKLRNALNIDTPSLLVQDMPDVSVPRTNLAWSRECYCVVLSTLCTVDHCDVSSAHSTLLLFPRASNLRTLSEEWCRCVVLLTEVCC